jgi:hypothetical protein
MMMHKFITRVILLVSLLILAALSVGCSAAQPEGQVNDLAQQVRSQLEQNYPLAVGQVQVEGERLLLEYQPSELEAVESSLMNSAAILSQAAVLAQEARQVQLTLYSASTPGEPVFAITVEGDLARRFAQGQVSMDNFLAGWQIQDLRAAQMALAQELVNLGYDEVMVGQAGAELQVSLKHPPASTAQGLVESVLPIFDLAERRFPEMERIQLTMSGPGALRISLPLEAIAAYRAGQLDAAGFLSQMEFVEVQ